MIRVAKELQAIADSYTDYMEAKEDIDLIGEAVNNEDKRGIASACKKVLAKLKSLQGYQAREYAKFIMMSLYEYKVNSDKLDSKFIKYVEGLL